MVVFHFDRGEVVSELVAHTALTIHQKINVAMRDRRLTCISMNNPRRMLHNRCQPEMRDQFLARLIPLIRRRVPRMLASASSIPLETRQQHARLQRRSKSWLSSTWYPLADGMGYRGIQKSWIQGGFI